MNQHHDADNPQPAPPRKKGSLLKWLLITFAALIALILSVIVILIASIPSIASSSSIREAIVDAINQDIPGELRINDWSFGWTVGPRVEGIQLIDLEGRTAFALDRFEADALSILSLMGGLSDLGTIEINQPTLLVERYDDNTTNLQKALGQHAETVEDASGKAGDKSSDASSTEPFGGLPFDLKARVQLNDGAITVIDPDAGTIEARFSSTLEMNAFSNLAASADITTTINGSPSTTTIRLAINDWIDENEQLTPETATADSTVTVNDFPLQILDVLAGDPILTSLLGNTLSAQLNHQGSVATTPLTLNVTSQQSSLTVVVEPRDEGLFLTQATTGSIKVRPETLALLMKDTPDAPELLEPVELGFRVAEPLLLGSEAPADMQATWAVANLKLNHAALPGPLALARLEGSTQLLMTNGNNWTSTLNVNQPEQLTLNNQPLPLGTIDAKAGMNAGTIAIDSVNINAASGGDIALNGQIAQDETYTSDLKLNINDLEIQPWVIPFVGTESFVKHTAGTLNIDLNLDTPLASFTTDASGSGTITIRNGNLTPLPVLNDILGIALDTPLDLNQVAGSSKLEDTADLEFTLQGDRINLQRADIVTAQATIEGSGTVTFDQQLDTVVSVSLTRVNEVVSDAIDDEIDRATQKIGGELGGLLGQLGKKIRKDVQEEVTDVLTTFTVTGPVSEPVIRKK
ncbi:AsmA family protein [Mucisphaera calidilacus]|uniref:Uncharacterized protein n=1 Tax=Mucisphaera calidilacus TaxID=2527982 RepID=A0A518C012_9BACT|nr:AsmA-like C-terminal region-containing protein [Mucisphaera calidilacus]QDU72566.1 hypothetical protein Pan265_24360 [Mucisphaera calidilacus]